MDKLEEIMLEYRGRKFMVIEPGGDPGDCLIYMGMEKKLKELGINCTFLRYIEAGSPIYYGLWRRILKILLIVSKLSDGLGTAISRLDSAVYGQTLSAGEIKVDQAYVILIHGGGNMNDLWPHGIRLLKNVINHNPESVIIVGPQSYWFRKANFQKLFLEAKQEIHFFCRERYSYDLLRSMNRPKNVHISLSHDTAFYLSKKDFHPKQGGYDLICFRTDKESVLSQKASDLKRLPRNGIIDLRQSENGLVVEDISRLYDFDDFANLIEGARKVFTDRLHVAILAAILGKDTTLFSNSYYKNKGVHEYSLFNYPNVKFVDIQRNSKEFEATLNLLLIRIGSLPARTRFP
ncbi:MAG: polysaccharide pyruvyl transferase family protein [Candidatus Bathyarchaeia archaeon]